MEAEKSLTFRLETYLMQLADIHHRWSQWLADSEQAALSPTPDQLLALEPSAALLFQELQQILSDRQQLLNDAQQVGLAAHDLTSLAQLLPAWERPALRQSLFVARQQLTHLRRLHVAAWVLISQAFQYYRDSLQLLMVGNHPHVYQQASQTDTGGGRLLDASL
jgi:hypothetical protein